MICIKTVLTKSKKVIVFYSTMKLLTSEYKYTYDNYAVSKNTDSFIPYDNHLLSYFNVVFNRIIWFPDLDVSFSIINSTFCISLT
jgi:hypothetical protein